ncbi:MAG TPA: transposase [Terriglobales bacterium]|nr:transposase [Terriglobales bacterium]
MSKRGRKRRNFSAAEKATILRRHLVDKVPVSDLCDEYKLQPGLFYLWQQQALANLERAIEKPGNGEGERQAAQERKIATLEAKLAKKDSIIAEISEEYVALKKELGEL